MFPSYVHYMVSMSRHCRNDADSNPCMQAPGDRYTRPNTQPRHTAYPASTSLDNAKRFIGL